ncbi:MAG TPA: glycoside hydrolase family 38 C-terminal domain-containing protein [Phycisphaerae bacterium]|nr:glycoside hydrolase family 38 C-terminal domain-containing protein [Phycisphaerae bacterium]HQA00454.1 glycoside hydrolase family 38 C-terminal domain-containing protein [Phycisphaerae bacterium]HQE27377.1 glycoside hydrolase family 38 C-terminal domain-containing protein [Phycisphaerae bacterium]
MKLRIVCGVLVVIWTSAAASDAATLTSAKLTALPAVLNTPDGPRQLLALEIESDGLNDLTCTIAGKAWAEPQVVSAGNVAGGKQRVELQVPVVAEAGPARVKLQSGSTMHEFDATLTKPRSWVVYLVQHTHTDIGYTWRQSEILPEHLRYIDETLDLCDATDHYPDDAKFRWTCEVSWTIREYLARRPARQIERLKRRLAEGRIELTGMFLNMSEIATESSLAASLQPLRAITAELGVPIRTAMQNDVNGAGWCLPDYFSGIGIKYLSMGINRTRSILPFDKPTVFWWESPSGKRTLAYRSDHYMTANFWALHDGRMDIFAPKCVEYLKSLEDRQYPFDRVTVQFSGYFTDNSRPSTPACDLVKTWNERYVIPKLRIATAGEFLSYVETHHADALPVHRRAWPDWWTDGFGSAARETAESRETHAGLQTTQGLLSLARLLGTKMPAGLPQRVAAVQEQLLFYDEHTFGAAGSILDPGAESTMLQWGEKGAYVWEAVKNASLLREEAFGALGGFLPKSSSPTLVIFNTLSWPRTGMVSVLLDSAVLPPNKQVRLVDLTTGEPVLVQGLHNGSHGTTAELWVRDVPPLGYKAFRVEVLDAERTNLPALDAQAGVLENRFYKLTLNPQTGAVGSLRDKRTDRELVDASAGWNLGQLIYERMTTKRDDIKRDGFDRTSVRNVKLLDGVAGPIFRCIRFEAALDGCAGDTGVRGEIRLYEPAPQIEFHFDVRKLPVVEPESLYVAFPFQAEDAQVVYEAQGGCVTPGRDQLPGSSSDWQTVQRYAAFRNPQSQIVWASNRVPLVQFGEINLGKWQPVTQIDKPHLYAWVMNNYWFTNFRATQEGQFRWSHQLTSTPDTTNTAATRFGWESCVPMAARVLLPGRENGQAASRSMLRCDAANLLLIEARPSTDGDGIVLHWREIEGKPATWHVADQPFAASVAGVDEVTVLEQPIRSGVRSVSFEPYEAKFVKITLK